jgi:CRISPR/Cas system-associated exonuclease Cas4 (RecB family)
MTITVLPPLNRVIDVPSVRKHIQTLDLDGIINFLNTKGVIVWPITISNRELFVVKDFETRHSNFIWASQLGHLDPLALFFNTRYSIKVYNEDDLRNIMLGLVVHESYQGVLKLAYPDVESEVKVVDRELGLVGVADIVFGDSVAEIKTGRKSQQHLLQLAAYLRMLKRGKGYIVYENEVVEISYSKELEEKLMKALEDVKKLKEIVPSHSIDDIISMFRHSYGRFIGKFYVDPRDLIKVLRERDFI